MLIISFYSILYRHIKIIKNNKIYNWILIVLLLITNMLTPCLASIVYPNDKEAVNGDVLNTLQRVYTELIEFPHQKKTNIDIGKSIVGAFISNSSNFTELYKVIDRKKNSAFIKNIISEDPDNKNKTLGSMISFAINKMKKDDIHLKELTIAVEEFTEAMQIYNVEKVIGYALSQAAIDKAAKGISKIEIIPSHININKLNTIYSFITSDKFIENMTKKIANIIPHYSIVKLPLINDIHDVNPVTDPNIIVYKPFLHCYFEDDSGEPLTNAEDIKSSIELMLPQPDTSNIINAKAIMTLMDSMVTMNNSYNKNTRYGKKKNDSILIQWFENHFDDLWIRYGFSKQNVVHMQKNKSIPRFTINSSINVVGADRTIDNIFIRLLYGYTKTTTKDSFPGKANIITSSQSVCINAIYKSPYFMVSGYLCQCFNNNNSYRIDKQNLQHSYKNTSNLSTFNINIIKPIALDNQWLFLPSIFIECSYYYSAKYKEKSLSPYSQLFDCQVAAQNNKRIIMATKMELKGNINAKHFTFIPKFLFSTQYELGDRVSSIDITLHECNLKLFSAPLEKIKVNFTAEASILSENITLSVKYLLQICSKYNTNAFFAEISYLF